VASPWHDPRLSQVGPWLSERNLGIDLQKMRSIEKVPKIWKSMDWIKGKFTGKPHI